MPPKHHGEHGEGKRAELREDITEAREWKHKMEEAERNGNHERAEEMRKKYNEARRKHYADAGKLDEYYEIRRDEGEVRRDRREMREDRGKPHREEADREELRQDRHQLHEAEGGRGGRGGRRGGHHGGD